MRNMHVDLTETVEEMYRSTDRIIMPLYPWVLVRPLPRAGVTASGLVVMPQVQNKPNLESVVLATWKPFWEKVEKVKENGDILEVKVWNESDLKPGDHIVHPHHVGLPDSYLDEKDYRMIREEDVMCVLNYHEKDWLRDMLYHTADSFDTDTMFVDELLIHYDIVPKHGYGSLTTSGK